jgi:ferritin-like metal-binding protein YciE
MLAIAALLANAQRRSLCDYTPSSASAPHCLLLFRAPTDSSLAYQRINMPIKTPSELFIHDLSDTYSAEKQMTRSLPRLARAATDPQLAQAFEDHLEETRAQVERIEEIAEALGLKLKRIKCEGMAGLVEETLSMVDQVQEGPVLDAALIGSAQKAEHYEIASYTSLILMAMKLGYAPAVPLLQATLAEEQATDKRLGAMAEASAIEQAEATS